MASIYDLKPAFQQLLRPVMAGLIQYNITPNQVTLWALALSFVGGSLLTVFHPRPWVLLMMPIILLVRMALNALDGMLARERQLSTRMGEILNELGDVISDGVLYVPLMFYLPPTFAAWSVLFLFLYLAMLSEFCGVLAKCVTGVRRYEGPMGKSDRAFLVSLYCIALFFWPHVQQWSVWIFGAACLLLTTSACNRIKPLAAEQGA